MINLNLSGKRALVCGASKGIGLATAIQLAALDCEVIMLARDENILQQVVAELPNKMAREHRYIAVDLLNFSALQTKINNEITQHGTIDILINNAGGPTPGAAVDAMDEQFEEAFKLHLRAAALLSKTLIPGMKQKNFGRIINIISTSVKSPIENLGVSNTVRAAVAAWAKTLSFEVAKFGITVNSVLPGSIETGRLESIVQKQAEKKQVSVEIIRQEMIAAIPAGRIGQPQEVANVIAFLASEAASYINGVALPVDGGRLRTL